MFRKRKNAVSKKAAACWLLAALCLMLMLPAAAETRLGVIYLEGMEEPIEETLYESPLGFSFWYVQERLTVRETDEAADPEEWSRCVTVEDVYGLGYMRITALSAEKAGEYLDGRGEDPAEERKEILLYQEIWDDASFHFAEIIIADGCYALADGAWPLETAEGNAKYFQRVLDSLFFPGPEDYIGRYTNGSYDEVVIGRQGEDYVMTVSLYRLTTLDEGTVSVSENGVVFHAIDPAGNPMTLSFYRDGADGYALRVEESTWAYLTPGTVFNGMMKAADGAATDEP